MPITLPVPGGGGATSPLTYYNDDNLGEYQFLSIKEIVANFQAAYVGEGKILENTLKADILFHAFRAQQELHYDTVKSCKSQEIEVCPSLKMPLPHDYINYVKLAFIDGGGIEHIIYPTRNTSHPFAIEQVGCEYVFNADGSIKHQETCEADTEVTCDSKVVNDLVKFYNVHHEDMGIEYDGGFAAMSFPYTFQESPGAIQYTFQSISEVTSTVQAAITSYCQCMSTNTTINCGLLQEGGYSDGEYGTYPLKGWSGSSYSDWYLPGGQFPTTTFISPGACTLDSNSWNNYSSSGSNNSVAINNPLTTSSSVDNDNYISNFGGRFGIDPQYAQANGSYFIDCIQGNIHFSSNLAGKTIVLKYISDGVGKDDDFIVHKFAEEAMYKWIAYGCLSARRDSPEYLIARFKKERFAETRKAKIRMSNIKIEEISQVFRGKSKWIKH